MSLTALDQGQPAGDGGDQDEDDHLGDVADVGLVVAVGDPDLLVEPLDVAEEAGVEDDDDGEGEEEDEADEGEHVHPHLVPFLVSGASVEQFGVAELGGDVLPFLGYVNKVVDLHEADPDADSPDETADGDCSLHVLQISKGEPDGQEPVNKHVSNV